jgi:general secretion pathway protein M
VNATTSAGGSALATWNSLKAQFDARWVALATRERWGVLVALGIVGIGLLWTIALGPALKTIREAPAQIDRLDGQLQTMQRMASEAQTLRGATPLSAAQAASSLQTATNRLGARARLVMQGDRATVTLNDVAGIELAQWLGDVRNAARARPVDVQLQRGPKGLGGTVVLALGSAP